MQSIHQYFQEVRTNRASLQKFFEQMPKGGDIHHHALGALWAEDVLEVAASMRLWVDTKTGQIHRQPAKAWYKASEIQRNERLYQELIDQWSIRNFNKGQAAAPQHFFDIFPKIEPVFVENEAFWLKKIAQQAAAENISYIETLIDLPVERDRVSSWALIYENWSKTPDELDFERFYLYLEQKGLQAATGRLVEQVEQWQLAVQGEDLAALGFQLYAVRNFGMLEVLAQLCLCFAAADACSAIVGVNLVAPEHHPNALAHYELQMRFCRWLRERYPEVNLALHAGELTSELVQLDQLDFHINMAVRQAAAQRIGHGVALLQEEAHQELLAYMAEQGVALEVLLDSNAFILGVEPAAHPFLHYWEAKVPLVLATDDPALLRTNLSSQFLRAAEAYPSLSYEDFKKLAMNSLDYSFLPQKRIFELKDQWIEQINQFEASILTSNFGQ